MIKEIRMSRKMTQKQLADAMKVSRSTVAMWETGAALPTADKLSPLSRVLGCSVDEILKKEETEPAIDAAAS